MSIYKDLVEHFGGQKKTAVELNVKQPSVHAWVTGKTKMSALVALRVEQKTQGKFKAVELCPEIKTS
ncbi:Cro/CI family transcriptional regulator [uncultured Agitococcus sp.]|uniref:Cro/CI family transcriptional regulator n=1 Tax=uncultured Agitococcus sp. TaxID=1506599 RepID=UPI0026044925|nr:Cro/CI family transcriptional regulator [uncultured Agitococcus sp.]